MKDIRQWPEWGTFISSLGWKTIKVGNNQLFTRNIPIINKSVIKFQRPELPIDFNQLDQVAKSSHALFLLLEPNVGFDYSAEYKKHGFHPSKITAAHTATIRIDISKSENDILSSFSENARRNIKKSQGYNLKVRGRSLNTADSNMFDDFMLLHNNLVQMKKFFVPSQAEFYKKYAAFKNISYIFFAYEPGSKNPIAAVWMAARDNSTSYLHTGITTRGYELLANYLLVWETIKYFRKKGCKIYDFEGVYDPRFPTERKSWIKFSEFKKRFHGETVEFPNPWIKHYNLLFRFIYLCGTFLSK